MSTHAVNIYCRMSLDLTGQSLGVQRQETECRELAERRGWTVANVYVDNSKSATSGKARPAFEEALEDGRDLVVWHVDRLSRKPRDLERVLDANVNVYSVQAGDLDLSTAGGRATARTLVAWANYETETKSARQAASHRQRAAQGRPFWANRPFGWVDATEVHPVETEALRQAFQAVLDGSTLASIARGWNERGLLTTKGGQWKGATVRQVLVSPRMISRLPQGEPGNWPSIVEEPTYRATLAVLTSPTRGRGGKPRQALLTGFLRCSICQKGMTCGQQTPGKGGSTYRCPVGHLSIREALVTPEVQRQAMDLVMDDDGAHAAPVTSVDASTLVAERDALQDRLDGLGTAYAQGLVTLRQMTDATSDLRDQIGGLDKHIGATAAPRFRTHGSVKADLASREGLARFTAVVSPGRGHARERIAVTWR